MKQPEGGGNVVVERDTTVIPLSLLSATLDGAAVLTARAAELLVGSPLTVDRWRVLELVEREAGLTMTSLASQLGMPSSTATRIVDHLVSDGAVHRVLDPADRRRVVLRDTERGHALLADAVHRLGSLEDEISGLLAARQAIDPHAQVFQTAMRELVSERRFGAISQD